MDHLPSLAKDEDRIIVPYVAINEYDNLAFSAYPQRNGMDKDKLVTAGDFGGRSSEEINAFVQTWLFFGTMAEVFGTKVETRHFVRRHRNGSLCITTKELPTYLAKWNDRDASLPTDLKRRQHIRVDLCLDEVNRLLLRHCSNFTSEDIDLQPQWPVDPAIILSIMVLGETLSRAKLKILAFPGSNSIPGWIHTDKRDWGSSSLLRERMLASGWCPNALNMLEATTSHVGGLYYASSLPLANIRKHQICQKNKCYGDLLFGSYMTRHTTPGCSCQAMGPDPECLRRALDEGSFPLLRYSASKTPLLEVTKYKKWTKYVAISHVWSDGLGNPISNTLPICQLQRLQLATSRLYKSAEQSVLFWIDTLCVPIEAGYRKIAVANMAEVYKNSHKCLVLDKDLLLTERRHEYLEPAMRISTSSWMRRLWTLQEGALSKSLYFEFSDGPLDIEELRSRYEAAPKPLENGVVEAAHWFYPTLRNPWDPAKEETILELWKAVQWRSTTRISDEVPAIGPLIGMDLSGIVHNANRWDENYLMIMMLKYIGRFPPGFIFLPGEKLRTSPFRWAPRTWMTGVNVEYPNPLSLPGEPGLLTPRGLLVKYPGVLLHYHHHTMGEEFWIPLSKDLSTWYHVEYCDRTTTRLWNDESIHNFARPAIILCRQSPGAAKEIALLVDVNEESEKLGDQSISGAAKAIKAGSGLGALIGNMVWQSRGLLTGSHVLEPVRPTSKTRALLVSSQCRVWVSLERDLKRVGQLREKFLQNENALWGEILSKDQFWCVD